MTALLIFLALLIGTTIGVLVMGACAAGKADDAYRRGCVRGRSDLKAEMVADALWHADHDEPERSADHKGLP